MINLQWFKSRNFNPVNYGISALLFYIRAMYAHNSHLGYKIWEDNPNDQSVNLSSLLITDQNTWDTSHRGHLPSIVVRRNPVFFGGGIQDGGSSRVVQAGYELETSIMEILTIPMVISCIARQDLEAEALAFMTSQFIWDDKRWARSFGIFGITSPQITNVKPYNISENAFECELITSMSLTRKFTTRLLPEEKVKKLSIELNNAINIGIET